MAKPIFRLGVSIDHSDWNVLLRAQEFQGVQVHDFFVDNAQRTIWLCFVADDRKIVHRVNDVTTKEGGLPMKWAGWRRESAELFHAYFGAAVDVAKAEQLVPEAEQAPVPSNASLEAARKDLEEAKARFEAALWKDARDAAESHDASVEEDQ